MTCVNVNSMPPLAHSHTLTRMFPPSTANLTYEIPVGVADDRFAIDPVRGTITTRGPLDREAQEFYTVPVYVTDVSSAAAAAAATASTTAAAAAYAAAARTGRSGNLIGEPSSPAAAADPGKRSDMFDVATVVVRITDVNDHSPEFRPGSCYPIAVPENGDTAVVHTVVATDLDDGANGDITYSITGE